LEKKKHNFMQEVEIFGIKINTLKKTEFLPLIKSGIENGHQIVQSGVNASSVVEISDNETLRAAIHNSDLVNIDGMSLVWALRFLGYKVPERVACPDLAEDILFMAEQNSYSVYLLGAREESLLLAEKKLLAKYPELRIVGRRNGYFNSDDEKEIIDAINMVNPDMVFLGMTSPKKELFVEKYRNILNVKYFLGVGGFFDILSGYTRRAPLWVQNIGMEWFYRFLQEPTRMWRRYLIGNIRFILIVLRIKLITGRTARKHV
jgi:N-acetylglucosaminyldiphosphoundecaprenol N-acetyl-beta-D-mannosaminyltransferase